MVANANPKGTQKNWAFVRSKQRELLRFFYGIGRLGSHRSGICRISFLLPFLQRYGAGVNTSSLACPGSTMMSRSKS